MTAALKGPGVGEAQRLLEVRGEKAWIDLVQKYGKNFLFQGVLATCDPELVETVLINRAHIEHRSSVYKRMARIIPGSPGLLFMDGEEWQQRIHAVMPIFTRANVDSYSAFIHECALSYASRWKDGEQLEDLFTSLTELGAATVLGIAYGEDANSKLGAELQRELIGYKFQTMGPRNRLDEFGFSWKKILEVPTILVSIVQLGSRVRRLRSIIGQILKERQGKAVGSLDCIQRLQAAGFSVPQITDDVNHLYGAFNAIDFCITAAFYELSRRPEWAEILRTELGQVLKDREYPTRSDFDALPNTIGFMKEIFRCYPVTKGVFRRTGEPIEVNGVSLPAGTEVLLLVYALHQHSDFWDDPEEFNPRRWEQPPRVEYSYIPFLTGSRQCIGRHLAEINFVIILNALLRRFDLDVLDHAVSINRFMIPRFERAMPFRVRRLS